MELEKEIVIRQATGRDALRIRNVHLASIKGLCAREYTPPQIEAWAAPRSPEAYRKGMANGEIMFVAVSGLRIVGFSCFLGSEINAVYVHPRYVRRGIGSSLLCAIETEARAQRLVTLSLHASLTALPFYLSHGYQNLCQSEHTVRNGIKIPCIVMSKKLETDPC